ncbi:hypothetical protein GSI_06973 [Ganoderma sinense ZZ0214-1]|uniref:Uncharacterized protein n=1 Tax=Ganoderma sinense ZZ0214-1 TaxID=1077348 RepID=A0A2G8SAM1_9APHY|nr:hypothetical protein GSI_06973 [Ganoderma sinense ZZ0214-1]
MIQSAESAPDPGSDTYSVEGVTREDLQSTEQRWNDYIHNLMGGEPDRTSNSPPRSPSPAGSDDDDIPALLHFYALNDTMWLARAPLPWQLMILQRDGTMTLVPDDEFADELCPRVLEMLVMDRHHQEREQAGLAPYGAPITEMLGGDLSEVELEHKVLLLEDVLCHRDNVAATWIPAHAPNRYHDIFLLNVDPEPWRSIQRDHSVYSLLQYTLGCIYDSRTRPDRGRMHPRRIPLTDNIIDMHRLAEDLDNHPDAPTNNSGLLCAQLFRGWWIIRDCDGNYHQLPEDSYDFRALILPLYPGQDNDRLETLWRLHAGYLGVWPPQGCGIQDFQAYCARFYELERDAMDTG